MSKINIKLMSDVTYATLKKNIESYERYFLDNLTDGTWINTITPEAAFDIKKYQIEDFELKIPSSPYDRETDLENAIILYEHLNVLPGYILAEPKFWMWVMFEKGYECSLHSMKEINATAFKHQWLFSDGLRRGLFFGILSRLYYRVELTYAPENSDDPYYLTKYVIDNPLRFREISWRTISNYKFVVKSMLKAELRVNKEIDFEEKGVLFSELAKEICKLGSIKLIDAMEEIDIENYIYEKYYKIVTNELERQKLEKYNSAIDFYNTDEVKKIQKARDIFKSLDTYMDSSKMIIICDDKIKKIKAKDGIFGFLKHKK